MSLKIIRVNGCPKCNGCITEDYDQYGKWLRCMQCGKIISYIDIKYHKKENKK